MQRIFGVFLLLLLIGIGALAFVFHHEILAFSDNVLTARETQDAVDTGNWADAIASYELKAQDHPDNLELAYTLGNLYLQNNQSDKASDVFRDILAKDPENLKATLQYGTLLSQRPEHLRKALDLYRKVLKANSGNAALLNAIGNVYRLAAENPAENRKALQAWLDEWAVYYYRMAIRLDPNNYEPHFNLGIAYQELKRLEKSATSYCNALLLDPENSSARYNLGLILVDLGDYDQAYREMSRGVHLLADQGSPEAAHALAEKVQTIKNMLYNQSGSEDEKLGQGNNRAQTLLNPACLTTGN